MIIDCISDLHGYFPKLDGGDLLIVAGDLTAHDGRNEHDDFIRWVYSQEYKKKVLIAGNHDNNINISHMNVCDNVSYLCDSFTEFEGLKIYGSPWTASFHGMNPLCKAFTLSSCKLEKKMAKIPYRGIDILITHGPPYGMFDEVERDVFGERRKEFLGSQNLWNGITPNIKLHVFGHIHEHGGKQGLIKHQGPNTVAVNASIMNERYEPVNKPVRIVL